jgi:hypothetical protein
MNTLFGLIHLFFTNMNLTSTEITLRQNQWLTLPQTQFYHATTGVAAPQFTTVKLKYDSQYLYLDFECAQNPFVDENTYTQPNTEMWNQEVFELFIASGTATPERYLELEINSNNALFVGWIDNPTGETPKNLEFVPYQESGIKHSVVKQKNSWSGQIQVPWTLLGGKKEAYRLNFYRIVSLQSHPNSNWKGTPADCSYLCWSPTMSGTAPRFHRPSAFGLLRLE